MKIACFATALRCLAAVTLLAGVVGCAHPTLVGKWRGKKVPFGNMSLPMTIEFKADGTDTRTFTSLAGTYVLSDTYVVKDGNIEITPVTLLVNGQSRLVPSLFSDPQDYSLKLSGDSLSLIPSGRSEPAILERVKS